VLPSAEQVSAHRWPSHKDQARKALAKLAAPHLPVTLKQLEKTIEKTHRAYEHAEHANPKPAAAVETDGPTDPENLDDGDDDLDEGDHNPVQDVVAGDVVDPGGAVGPDGQVHSDADPGRTPRPALERGETGIQPESSLSPPPGSPRWMRFPSARQCGKPSPGGQEAGSPGEAWRGLVRGQVEEGPGRRGPVERESGSSTLTAPSDRATAGACPHPTITGAAP
jgi:hypothetical protein